MPISGSFASLSKHGFSSYTTTTLVGNQYVVTTSGSFGALDVTSTGNVYFLIGSTSMGVGKMDINGNVLFAKSIPANVSNGFSVTNTGSSIAIVDVDNVVVTGTQYTGTSNVTYTGAIIKYDNTGNIAWQRGLPMSNVANVILQHAGESVQVDTSNNIYGLMADVNNFANYRATLIKYDSNGTYINQRDIYSNIGNTLDGDPRSIYLSTMCVDNTNQKMIVTGYGSYYNNVTTQGAVVAASYDWTNTSNTNPVVYSANANIGGSSSSHACCTDGTYIYNIPTNSTSGFPTLLEKTNLSNGAVVFSKTFVDGARKIYLTSVDIDTVNGFLYVIGYINSSSGYIYIAKLNASDATPVWEKTINPSTTYSQQVSLNIRYKANFIYFTGYSPYMAWKLKADGTTPDGTYGNFVLTTITVTQNNLNTYVTGVINDPGLANSWARSNTIAVTANSTSTYTTTTIP